MRLLTNNIRDIETIKKICSVLDYSASLVPNATSDMVKKACEEAKRYHYAAVPVFPSYISLVAEQLKGTGIVPQCAVGFPSGGVTTASKVKDAEQGIADGATEFDMVINIGRLLDKDYRYVEKDIRAVVDTVKPAGFGVKVIIETGVLQDSDKKEAVEIICAAGAEYVKTCTGFYEGKATVHDIALLKECSRGRIKIKASGGILTLEDALVFMEAGADRVAGRFTITDQLEKMGIMSL